MNYPVTADYLADRLWRALEELPKGSVIANDIRQLALFYGLMNDYTQLTARDQEVIAEMARNYVERDDAVRRENEQRKRQSEIVRLADGVEEFRL